MRRGVPRPEYLRSLIRKRTDSQGRPLPGYHESVAMAKAELELIAKGTTNA